MKKTFLVSIILLASVPAHADEVTAPVQSVIDMTTANWAQDAGEAKDIFAADLLDKLYSRDFANKYREAAKFPAYDGGDSPFDYDVITNGQDGCPLEEVSVTAAESKDGVTDVVAKFKNTTCFGSEPEYQRFSEVHFDVVSENGAPVIDDIHTLVDETTYGSLKEDMVSIAGR